MTTLTTNYEWQEQAIVNFRNNKYRGIVQSVTGSGKTRFAINVFKELRVRTLVVVPTIALMKQWHKELLSSGVKEKDLGIYFGLHKEFKPVTVAVINSVSDLYNLHEKFDFLIMDEVHRYASDTFQNIILNNNFIMVLGLTATLQRTDDKQTFFEKKNIPVIYSFNTTNALDSGIINDFKITVTGIDIPLKEKEYLMRLDTDIKSGVEKFGDLNGLLGAVKKGNKVAASILKFIGARKKFYNHSIPKIHKAISVCEEEYNKGGKIIIFNEYTDTANLVYNSLVKKGFNVYLYHSKECVYKSVSSGGVVDKKEFFNKFIEEKNAILVTVKSLDEGLNVPDLNIGIVIGYNKTARQAIQRLGRIIRKNTKGNSQMYLFYYRGTSDFWNIKNFINNFGNEKILWK